MSEFQYYEWQAIDRALTEQEVREVNRLSSHMDIVTRSQAVVTYSWGDFKHDPADVVLGYFDAMLYWTNWGTRELVFRFPKGSIDASRIAPYTVDRWMTLEEAGEYYLLQIETAEEEPPDWEKEPALSPFIPLRQQIIDGDYRALYLAWLAAAEAGEEVLEDDTEPPVPPGLQELAPSLQALADEILSLNRWLLQVAAAASEPQRPPSDAALTAALNRLPPEEARGYLLKVLEGEPQVRAALRKRLSELAGVKAPTPPAPRSVEDLLAEAERVEREGRRREQEAAERKRIRRLNELAAREDAEWEEVEGLIEQKQRQAYQQAVSRLQALRELADYQGRPADFSTRVSGIRRRYKNRPALLDLLDRAGL